MERDVPKQMKLRKPLSVSLKSVQNKFNNFFGDDKGILVNRFLVHYDEMTAERPQRSISRNPGKARG